MHDEMEELLPVVSELARKYTGYESTSIPYEKAQMLMGAVLYCLEEYDRSDQNGIISPAVSVQERYAIGLQLVRDKVESIKILFEQMTSYFKDYGVRCLHDTVLKGIPQFLKQYDIRFCPQDTILTLDYPVLAVHGSQRGADAVYAYLCSIRVEQQFLGCYDPGYVLSVLEQYRAEYRDMVENVCGIVLLNTIGHIAAGKPLQQAGFEKEDDTRILELFAEKTISETEDMITCYIKNMVSHSGQTDLDIINYLCGERKNMAARIHWAVREGQLRTVFLI